LYAQPKYTHIIFGVVRGQGEALRPDAAMGTKPDMPLTDKEKEEVKKITAKDLLRTLKREKFVLVWRKRQQA
jgi:hypothetical protein